MAEGEVEDKGDGEGAELFNVGFHASCENCTQIRCKKYCQKCGKKSWTITKFDYLENRRI